MDFKLELVPVPVSDVDRAIEFYTKKVGFHLDYDHNVIPGKLRFVQITPPGSACSIALGTGITDEMKPGFIKGLQVVVDDIEKAREELLSRGVEVSEIQKFDWGHFVFFEDPDGNKWSVQYIPNRSKG
jgi:catechol 2,3-dioxygenase-like lactoylglutathione lyase family enzyme